MATPVEMPKLGNTVEECVLTSWRKRKGESLTVGDVIAEIETDKTTFELTAPTGGFLLETFFEAGALVPVFTVVCVVGAEGESAEEFRPAGSPKLPSSEPRPGAVGSAEPKGRASAMLPGAESPASRLSATAAISASPEAPIRATPRARRFSRERDFHPPEVIGSGPGGRVLETDLRSRFHSSPRPRQAQETVGREPLTVVVGPGGQTRPRPMEAPTEGRRLSTMRTTIARRLRDGLSSTAQYTLHGSANAGQLLALRKRLKASAETSAISINDLVVYCAIRALLEVPELNAELVDDTLYMRPEVHMAFACDTPRGLVVPVVRDSQGLSLRGLSLRMKELAGQAVAGVIAVDDLSGGTFTVSNLGNLGIESFTPVLNPPQVAILGVDAIQVKPVRKADGNIEFVDAIGLSLTVDHQVIDGAPGARFLGTLRGVIEGVEALCTI